MESMKVENIQPQKPPYKLCVYKHRQKYKYWIFYQTLAWDTKLK